MMRFSENRKLAFAVLVLCIIVSIVALGGDGMARKRSKALQVFDEGAAPSLAVRHSMDAYLDSAADSARLMVSEAELRIGSSEMTGSISSLADLVGDEVDMDARYDAYVELKSEVDRLYNGMYDAVDSDSFAGFKLAYDDFWGYDNMIRYDEYHQMARKYNQLIRGFPGSIVANLFGLHPLNTFGG